jgi:hypothetical protein
MPAIPIAEKLDLVAPAAVQHARGDGEGTVFAIDSGKGLIGGEAHLLQAGHRIESLRLQPRPLKGRQQRLPLGEGQDVIDRRGMQRNRTAAL